MKIPIYWSCKYSFTMESDKHNRWARLALCGNYKHPFYKDKVASWVFAEISKLRNWEKPEFEGIFIVNYYFPNSIGKYTYTDLNTAKKEVNKSFRWFIKRSIVK